MGVPGGGAPSSLIVEMEQRMEMEINEERREMVCNNSGSSIRPVWIVGDDPLPRLARNE